VVLLSLGGPIVATQTDQCPATLSAVHSNSTMHSTTVRSYTCWVVLHLLGGPTPGRVVLPSLGGPIVAIQTDPRPATLSAAHSNSTMHSTTARSYTCWGVLHLVGWSYPRWVVLHLLGGPTPGGVVLPSLGGPIVAIQTDQRPATLSCTQQQHNALNHCTVLHLLGGPTPARGSYTC